jgi:hypothetical protein
MARKMIAGRHGERAVILHLLVRVPEKFNGVDSHDHLVSRICLLGNVGPAFLPRVFLVRRSDYQ